MSDNLLVLNVSVLAPDNGYGELRAVLDPAEGPLPLRTLERAANAAREATSGQFWDLRVVNRRPTVYTVDLLDLDDDGDDGRASLAENVSVVGRERFEELNGAGAIGEEVGYDVALLRVDLDDDGRPKFSFEFILKGSDLHAVTDALDPEAFVAAGFELE